MDFAPTTVVFIVVGILIQAWVRTSSKNNKKLPPGPTGFPILGSLHLLGKFPHRDLHRLSKNYGPLMSMRLGSVRVIVVSSPEAAEAFLKTHDLNFSSHPNHVAGKHLFYNQQSISFSPYGSYWRDMRKLITLELLSGQKLASSKEMRKEELGLLIDYIKEASKHRVPVDVSAKVSALSANMSCRMIFGKKYSDEELNGKGLKTVIQELLHLAAVPNIADYIPNIARFDLRGLTKRMKAVSKTMDVFLDKIIDEHIQNNDDDRGKDFVDIMLGFMDSEKTEHRIRRDTIEGIVVDLLAASMDTAAAVVEWAFSELVIRQTMMKKLQKELDEKVGRNRMVEESDLEGLDYLDMVVKETFRLHPPAPLMIPHKAIQDCTVNGYFIPQDSRVIINLWAIGRDGRAWEDAEKFNPERFAGSEIDVRGRDFRLIPFGSGRRICPGIQLGITLVNLMVAQLVHCFDWELPNGLSPSELDMSEEFGIVTPRAYHLLAVPTYRLLIT